MARNLLPNEQLLEEDYIDMDINSTAFLCYTMSSPPHSREFEFYMSTNLPERREPITSPADELFYKGKLLPLHLPPRLQMVQKLLQNSNTILHGEDADLFEVNIANTTTTTTINTATTTPFESCNISPTNSCYVSGELNPDEYFYECSSSSFVQSHPKKSWSKKLKLIRQTSLGLKLKASRAYLKSLFTKSGCSDESCAVPKAKEWSNGYPKVGKKNPFGQIQRERYLVPDTTIRNSDGEKMTEENCGHRRSFSGAIRRYSKTKSSTTSSSCSSSSSSFSSVNSNGLHAPKTLKRSSSVKSEVENSIQGAIAYCKKTQQLVCARKSVSDVGFCSLSSSRIAAVCENQERPGLCRG